MRLVRTLSERIRRVLSRQDYTPRQFLREMGLEPSEETLRRLDQWKTGVQRPTDPEQLRSLARVLDGSPEELHALVEWEERTDQLETLEERHEDSTYHVHYQYQDGTANREEYSGWRSTDDVLKRVQLQLKKCKDDRERTVDCVRVNTPDAVTYRLNSVGTVEDRCPMESALSETSS